MSLPRSSVQEAFRLQNPGISPVNGGTRPVPTTPARTSPSALPAPCGAEPSFTNIRLAKEPAAPLRDLHSSPWDGPVRVGGVPSDWTLFFCLAALQQPSCVAQSAGSLCTVCRVIIALLYPFLILGIGTFPRHSLALFGIPNTAFLGESIVLGME